MYATVNKPDWMIARDFRITAGLCALFLKSAAANPDKFVVPRALIGKFGPKVLAVLGLKWLSETTASCGDVSGISPEYLARMILDQRLFAAKNDTRKVYSVKETFVYGFQRFVVRREFRAAALNDDIVITLYDKGYICTLRDFLEKTEEKNHASTPIAPAAVKTVSLEKPDIILREGDVFKTSGKNRYVVLTMFNKSKYDSLSPKEKQRMTNTAIERGMIKKYIHADNFA